MNLFRISCNLGTTTKFAQRVIEHLYNYLLWACNKLEMTQEQWHPNISKISMRSVCLSVYLSVYLSVCLSWLNFIHLIQAQVHEYGVDPIAPLPEEVEEDGVVIPETLCSLDERLLEKFIDTMSDIPRSDLWDISTYVRAVQVFEDLAKTTQSTT